MTFEILLRIMERLHLALLLARAFGLSKTRECNDFHLRSVNNNGRFLQCICSADCFMCFRRRNMPERNIELVLPCSDQGKEFRNTQVHISYLFRQGGSGSISRANNPLVIAEEETLQCADGYKSATALNKMSVSEVQNQPNGFQSGLISILNINPKKGEFYTSFDCSEMCLCDDEVLSCDYHCSPNAVCVSNPSTEAQCTCIMGLYGNGINCTRFQDCQDLFEAGYREEGVYTLDPSGWFGTPFDVYCKGGWMVLQRQHDGSIEFNRTWSSYKEGFGNADGDQWLGNDKLSFFTNKSRHQLRVDLGRMWSNGSELVTIGTTWFYEGFQISSEETNFVLTYDVGTMDETTGYDYLRYHNDTPFTTIDRDNDRHSVENCAARHSGGWWFKSCYASNLNGKYGEQGETGICIIKRNDQVPVLFCDIIFTEMAMRPM